VPAGSSAFSPTASRFHEFDAARAFALLLGVFFHAAESFGPNNTYWAVVDSRPSHLLEWLRFASHSFRLELFFVLAGYFARLMIVRRGVAGFWADRLRRIGMPLVIGWLALYPIVVLLWLWGRSRTDFMTDLGIPPEQSTLPVDDLWRSHVAAAGMLGKIGLFHLWFLHQLLSIYLMALAGKSLLRRAGWAETLHRWIDRRFAQAGLVAALVALTLISLPILLRMRSWTTDSPTSFVPILRTSAFFGVCFLVGWFLHRQPAILQRAARHWQRLLLLAVGLWIAFGLMGRYQAAQLTPEAWGVESAAGLPLIRAGWFAAYALMMWAFVLAFLGIFSRYCQAPRAWVRYLSDSSYWVYLAHFPLIVALQVLLAPVALPWIVKYGMICAAATVVLLVSYHHLVRGTRLGVVLNGRQR
jgi:peptidoglycan/LPS O-acetylase OafA/YrhL